MSILTTDDTEICASLQICVVTVDITADVCYTIIVIKKVTTIFEEVITMSNYSKASTGNEARIEFHDTLGLTGAEISVNDLPAGAGVPFVHSHKQNEEVYVVLSGKGKAVIDGETVTLKAGDLVRISPAAKRQFFAADDEGIKYICIQVKENSLEEYTANDAVIY